MLSRLKYNILNICVVIGSITIGCVNLPNPQDMNTVSQSRNGEQIISSLQETLVYELNKSLNGNSLPQNINPAPATMIMPTNTTASIATNTTVPIPTAVPNNLFSNDDISQLLLNMGDFSSGWQVHYKTCGLKANLTEFMTVKKIDITLELHFSEEDALAAYKSKKTEATEFVNNRGLAGYGIKDLSSNAFEMFSWVSTPSANNINFGDKRWEIYGVYKNVVMHLTNHGSLWAANESYATSMANTQMYKLLENSHLAGSEIPYGGCATTLTNNPAGPITTPTITSGSISDVFVYLNPTPEPSSTQMPTPTVALGYIYPTATPYTPPTATPTKVPAPTMISTPTPTLPPYTVPTLPPTAIPNPLVIPSGSVVQGPDISVPAGTTVQIGYTKLAKLNDGKVMIIVGGANHSLIFDPSTDTWNTIANPNNTSSMGTHLIALGDGRALLIYETHYYEMNGALQFEQPKPEIYDPITNIWTPTTGNAITHKPGKAVLLNNGQVLIVGTKTLGIDELGNYDQKISAEIFNPTTSTFYQVNAPSRWMENHRFELLSLSDGRVLYIGKNYWIDANIASDIATYPWMEAYSDLIPGTLSSTAEIFHPSTGYWDSLTLPCQSEGHVVLLSNGHILDISDIDINYSYYGEGGPVLSGGWDGAASYGGNDNSLSPRTPDIWCDSGLVINPFSNTFYSANLPLLVQKNADLGGISLLSNGYIFMDGPEYGPESQNHVGITQLNPFTGDYTQHTFDRTDFSHIELDDRRVLLVGGFKKTYSPWGWETNKHDSITQNTFFFYP